MSQEYMRMRRKIVGFESIVLGFTLHAIGGILWTITHNMGFMIVLGVIAWIYIIKGLSSVRFSLNANKFSGLYKKLLYLYLLICLVMIVRGYLIDYDYQWISLLGCLNYHFLDKYYLLPYLMPIVCFIPWRYYKLDRYIIYASWLGLLSFFVLALLWNTIVQSSVAAMNGSEILKEESGVDYRFYSVFAFAVLLVAYMSPKKWIFNMLGLVSVLFINMIAARRGSSLSMAVLFVGALFFWAKYNYHKYKFMSMLLVCVILSMATYFVLNSSLFDFLFMRGMSDSRSGVDEALLSQMNDGELIFGKGLNGRYYYPILEDDYWKGWRYGSETGFYNMVLKGGYLMAIVYILLLIIPAFKGLFQSHNFLCKAGGFFILLSLFELYPFGWLEFSVKFLVIWMMVVLCMNPYVRQMNDAQIKQQFFI